MAPRTIQVLVKRVASRAHIRWPVTPHVLRHTFAVTAVPKGISLPPLQRLLGHDRLTTTEIYLNLSPEDVIREFHRNGSMGLAWSVIQAHGGGGRICRCLDVISLLGGFLLAASAPAVWGAGPLVSQTCRLAWDAVADARVAR
jgi:Phage integrase family